MEFEQNYYQILGIPKTASEEQIKKVYRKLAQIYHPDTTVLDTEHARHKFQEITTAYETLIDAAQRAKHDRTLTEEFELAAINKSRPLPPKPVANVRELDFGNLLVGEIGQQVFVVNNEGGPVTKIIDFQRSNESGWFKLTRIKKLSDTEPTPVEVEVTVYTQQLHPGQQYRAWIEANFDGEIDRIILLANVISRIKLMASTEQLDFGFMPIGSKRSLKFRIDNVGGGTQHSAVFRQSEPSDWFSISRINKFSDETAYPMDVEITVNTENLVENKSYEGWVEFEQGSNGARIPVQVEVLPKLQSSLEADVTSLGFLKKHTEGIWQVAFSPDGQMLASGGDDHQLWLWEKQNDWQPKRLQFRGLRQRFSWASPSPVWQVVFSPDGNFLAFANGEKIRFWKTGSRGTFHELTLAKTHRAHAIAFSPDNAWFVADGSPHEIWLWRVKNQRLVATFNQHQGEIHALAFSPDGEILASCGGDGLIYLWGVQSGKIMAQLKGHSGSVRSVAFSPDGTILASAGGVRFVDGQRVNDKTIRLWNWQTGQETRTLTGHTSSVESLAFHPNGQILTSAGVDSTIRLWDVNTGQEIKRIESHTKSVNSIVFNTTGDLLASGSWDGTIGLHAINVLNGVT